MSGYMRDSIVTPDVVNQVDEYIRTETDQVQKYDNRAPFDESGIFSLHLLAAQIFAKGYELGQLSAEARHHGQYQRRRDAEIAAASEADR